MRLTQLTISGLKAADRTIDLSPVVLLAGPNGAGKTAVLQALHLLALGSAPGLPSTADGVMRLARDGQIKISATLVDGAKRHTVERSWTRGADGKVTEQIAGSIVPKGSNLAARKGMLASSLGGWSEAWKPDDLLSLSPAKLRQRLVQLLGGEDLTIARWLPEDAPGWAAPAYTDQQLDEWITRTVAEARRRVLDAQADCRKLDVLLEQTASGGRVDTAPIKARLSALRAELARAQEHAGALARVAKAEESLAAARSRLATDAPSVAFARDMLESAIADEERAKGAEQQRAAKARELAQVRRDLAQVLATIKGVDQPSTMLDLDAAESELAECREQEQAATEALGKARERMTAAKARVEALGENSPLESCPHCGGDLVAALAAAYDLAVTDLRVATEAEYEADKAAKIAASHRVSLERRVQRVTREVAAREALADGWALEQEAAALEAELSRPAPSTASLTEAMADARAVLAAAEARAGAEAAVERLELEVQRQRADLGDDAPRAAAAIEAEIRAAETALVAAGQANEAADLRESTEEQIKLTREEEIAAKRWLEKFQAIEGDILKAIKERIEGPASAVLGKRVTVVLRDARGGDTCRFAVGGVDVSSISTGERLAFVAGLLIALAGGAQSQWRPLVLDSIEAVSANNRPRFLESLAAAARDGRVDQVIVAGCPDIAGAPEGVQLVTFGERGEAAAA